MVTMAATAMAISMDIKRPDTTITAIPGSTRLSGGMKQKYTGATSNHKNDLSNGGTRPVSIPTRSADAPIFTNIEAPTRARAITNRGSIRNAHNIAVGKTQPALAVRLEAQNVFVLNPTRS